MQGKIVYHPLYGRGVAREIRRSGMEQRVKFDNGTNGWVRVDDLESIPLDELGSTTEIVQRKADKPESVAKPRSRPPSRPQSQTFVERKVIETLRLGIVPQEGLRLFTHGRESEIELLMQWLANPHLAAQVLIGAYGTGKTHLLNYFRLLALDAGYAVSLIEMDPQATPFSKPKQVYHQIVRNLQWRDGHSYQGFRRLVERALRGGLLQDHRYFRHMRGTFDLNMWTWIDGSDKLILPRVDKELPRDFPRMYDYTTAANIYCYLLSGLGAVCQSPIVGLKGLLILFDESEALYAARGMHQDRSANYLDAVIGTADGDADMLKGASQTNLTYAGHADDIPFLYQRPSGLKLLFAFTSEDDLWVSAKLAALSRLFLLPLDDAKVGARLRRTVARVYEKAYKGQEWKLDKRLIEEMLVGHHYTNTRDLMKSFVEALDILRFGTYTPEDDW